MFGTSNIAKSWLMVESYSFGKSVMVYDCVDCCRQPTVPDVPAVSVTGVRKTLLQHYPVRPGPVIHVYAIRWTREHCCLG